MVKGKSKKESGAGENIGQARRLGIFGASGCGKTTKARNIIRNLNRVVYFEPLVDDCRRLANEDKFKICYTLEDLTDTIRVNWQNGFKIAFMPQFGKEELMLSLLSIQLMNLQSGYGIKHAAQITLVVDELDLSFPSGITQRMPANGFKNLCCRGRHTGINIIGLSQRMHIVDNIFRANCNAFYLYRHAEPADIDTGVKILGREYRQSFKDLNNFEYIYKEGTNIFIHK